MFSKPTLFALAAAAALFGGSIAAPAPAHAVGTKNGKCSYYDSFVGTSSKRGNSSTAGEKKLCGNVKVRVKYTVSGGSGIWTGWKTGTGMVTQPGVGYDVFQGEHTVTDPTLGATPSKITT